MKSIAISGSLAFDHIMSYPGKFEEAILPEKLANLSVSFNVSDHDVFFGGCAGNIAYNLKLVGGNPLIFGVLGDDFEKYTNRFKEYEISTKYIEVDQSRISASAYVLSDSAQNQITFFSPSVMLNENICMDFSDLNRESTDLIIISPDNPKRMLAMAVSARQKNIPYIFDPGQIIPILDEKVLLELTKNSIGIILNDYELSLVKKMLSLEIDEILKLVDFVVETLGEGGVNIFEKNKENVLVPAIKLDMELEPTGAGDSFRGGFLFGLASGLGLRRACEMGTVCASFSLQSRGTQNHSFTRIEFEELLHLHFGDIEKT